MGGQRTEKPSGLARSRAFLDSGVCGHIEAAVQAAKQMGVGSYGEKGVRFQEPSRVKERGAAALQPLGSSAGRGSTECFAGMVQKAQRIWSTKQEQKKDSTQEVGCFGIPSVARGSNAVAESVAPLLQREESSAGATAPRLEGERRESSTQSQDAGRAWTSCQVTLLEDGSTFEFLKEELRELPSQSRVYVRAYSFDQPDLVGGLKACVERGVRVHVVADVSQASGKTKLQLQVLKELQSAGARVKLTKGLPVGNAYAADKRSVKVGAGLRGIHHAKSCLIVLPDGVAKLVVGSCNFTTSSKANRESKQMRRIP